MRSCSLLAFAMHTVADLTDVAWKAARKRFFEDLRAITTYLVFSTWAELIEILRSGRPPVIPDG